MKYLIRGDKLQVTDSIKDYIQDKLSKMDKYLDDPENVEAKILIKVKGVEQRVEVTIQTKGYFLRAEESHSDLYAAIDKDIDILEGQVRKMKTKKDKQNMTESIRVKNEMMENETEVTDEIIKVLYYDIKPMTPEDAKLKLQEQPQNRFLAFIDVDTGKTNIIYRLKDNKNFGLVEPEA